MTLAVLAPKTPGLTTSAARSGTGPTPSGYQWSVARASPRHKSSLSLLPAAASTEPGAPCRAAAFVID